jgi:YihY family inner membrane protein
MDLLRPVRALDRRQQRSKRVSIVFAVIKKFGDDQAGSLAALVAYYAFFSIFPLLLVFVTVLGFVLQGDPSAQRSVESSVLGQFPIIGTQLKGHSLHGHAIALAIGVVTSVLAGLGVTGAAQNALNQVWAVPKKQRPDFFGTRLRGLALLALLGGLFILTTGASGLVAGGLGGAGAKIGGILVALLLNFVLFMTSFRMLTGIDLSVRELLPGVVFAAVMWEVLQTVGGIYINHVVRHASSTYGLFALVIGVLTWLHLGAQMTLYGAEINVVLARHLYPRSLFGPPEEPADQKTLTALAKVEERSEIQRVDVAFEEGEDGGEGDGHDDGHTARGDGEQGAARTGGPAPPAESSR